MNCRTLLSICTYFFFISCSDKKANEKLLIDSYTYIPLKQQQKNTVENLTDILTDFHIIYLKTPDSLFIASVSKVIYYQGKYFILDRKFSTLTCFNQNGDFLLQYGKIGLGKNEFKAIQDFDIDSLKKEVVIYSNEDLAFYHYLISDGSFTKKQYIGFNASAFTLLASGQTMLYANYKLNRKMLGFNFLILDSNAQEIKKFLRFNPKLSSIGWSFTGFLNKSNNQVFFTDAFNDSVFSYISNDFDLFCIVNINSLLLQQNKYDHTKILKSKIILDSSTSFLKNNFYKNSAYIIFNYQIEKRTKIAIYEIKSKVVHILTAKDASDPLLIIARNLMYLDNTKLIFAISPTDILNLRQTKEQLFQRLPKDIKDKLIIADSLSNFYLLTANLKE